MALMTLTRDAETTDDWAEDCRREARVVERHPVRMFEPFSGRFYAAETSNVSTGGLCVVMGPDVSLRAGRFVTLHGLATFGPRLADAAPRTLTARVVWARVDADDDATLRVGLQLYATPIAAAA